MPRRAFQGDCCGRVVYDRQAAGRGVWLAADKRVSRQAYRTQRGRAREIERGREPERERERT